MTAGFILPTMAHPISTSISFVLSSNDHATATHHHQDYPAHKRPQLQPPNSLLTNSPRPHTHSLNLPHSNHTSNTFKMGKTGAYYTDCTLQGKSGPYYTDCVLQGKSGPYYTDCTLQGKSGPYYTDCTLQGKSGPYYTDCTLQGKSGPYYTDCSLM
ncbi:hypothetical protein BST61_g895 [Cercospora zeina]